ncbi:MULTISPECIES: CpaF family protein [unclassified Streptomyces]|uniref:CpaF family protein n=1 Tax=unclassified Streptomyces TaxID=2593676 RepID=UPI000BACE414|nr:ATPase, T2SS/T4P/T4SS family [Streptomyces sp. CLI2509]ASY36996.1 ATP/GTP-binding protein [Streptomyces sp. CLI2509]MYX19764.1 CpaF family protein [Streptomyces sp. SID8380]
MADTHQRPGVPAPLAPDHLAGLLSERLARRAPAPATEPARPHPIAQRSPASAVPRLAELPGALPVAYEVVEGLQSDVSALLSQQDPDRMLAEDDRRALARSLTANAVATWATTYAQGAEPLTPQQEKALANAVFDAMFRGGRLQSLLDEDGVEDVMVKGTTAWVEYYDRPRRTVEGIADSNDEIVTWVNRMSRQSGHGERQLTQATPMVGFRLGDGSRVTASLLTGVPSLVIRKHRIQDHGIEQLIQWGTLNPLLARFLTACVHARRNVIVVGDMGSGKTTLLRALGREIPADERLVTLESDRELYLDAPGDGRGPLTFGFEARQSNGERAAGDRAAGEVTIDDMFPTALRYNASRVIVGEVRSTEIVPMLQAMSAGGSGSMCTLHARTPHTSISRLVQLCTEAGMSTDASNNLIASAIDLVVYITYRNETAVGGRRLRFVSHVLEVADLVGEGGRPVTTTLFGPQPGAAEPRAVFQNSPSPELAEALELTGLFDRRWLTDRPLEAWGRPLETVRRGVRA